MEVKTKIEKRVGEISSESGLLDEFSKYFMTSDFEKSL